MTAHPRLRFLAASVCATTTDAIVLFACHHLLAIDAGIATIAGCLAGGLVNFMLGRSWVFADRRASWWRTVASYLIVVVGGAALISGAVVAALAALAIPVVLAKAAAVLLTMLVWTYPMSSRVITQRGPAPAAVDSAVEIHTPVASSGTAQLARSSSSPPRNVSPTTVARAW